MIVLIYQLIDQCCTELHDYHHCSVQQNEALICTLTFEKAPKSSFPKTLEFVIICGIRGN